MNPLMAVNAAADWVLDELYAQEGDEGNVRDAVNATVNVAGYLLANPDEAALFMEDGVPHDQVPRINANRDRIGRQAILDNYGGEWPEFLPQPTPLAVSHGS